MQNMPTETQKVSIISPHTKRASEFDLPINQDEFTITPMDDKRSFKVLIATVRAKKSKQNTNGGLFSDKGRTFDVRIILHDKKERLLTFDTANSKQDIDLRSKDRAAFVYDGSRLLIVQNISTGQHLVLSRFGG